MNILFESKDFVMVEVPEDVWKYPPASVPQYNRRIVLKGIYIKRFETPSPYSQYTKPFKKEMWYMVSLTGMSFIKVSRAEQRKKMDEMLDDAFYGD